MSAKRFDNDVAVQLVKAGGTFVFLDVPPGMEFGIDMKVWTTGEKFKGVKMIPPGPHYIYFSARNIHGDTGPRSGFIHVFRSGEFLVRKWNPATEDILIENLDEEQLQRFKDNLQELDKYLGAYPFEIWNKWKSLSEHITENVVRKLMPECGCIRSIVDLVTAEKNELSDTKRRWSKSRTEEERQEDLLPQLVPTSGTGIRFSEMPARRYPDGSSPSEITYHYLDSTYALNTMLSSYSSPLEFIGEIQFAFICFLIGLNLEAFDQWKRLVQLMCNCMNAIKRYTQMYSEFISCLEAQLEEIPEDFLVDIVANNNIIYRSLRDFFANMELLKDNVNGRLYCKFEKFRVGLTLKFGWDFSNLQQDEDDEAPVVVELETL